MTSIGRRINEYRRQRNITQEQLAEAMGVTSQAVSKWENDISCPDISVLPQLADYFGVNLDLLIRGDSPNTVQYMPTGQRKDINTMAMRMLVNSSGGDIVKINLPIPLVKAAMEIGLPIFHSLQMGNNDAVGSTIKQVDFSALLQLAESGAMGKLLEVQSASGDTVEIYVD